MNSTTITLARPVGWLARLRSYWALIKDLQTGLLVLTAAAGYATGCCTNPQGGSFAGVVASLFLAVSGCTVLNMVYDRDIDAQMERTCRRPLPAGQVSPAQALWLGGLLSAVGVGWAFVLNPLYGGVVLAGLVLDALVYTVWLKRRSPFSIVIGGLSGGMPALAGRVLATGRVDEIGLLLALGVLLWIPTHMMTFSIRSAADYARARIPTFPSIYGVPATRAIIAVSTFAAVAAFWSVSRMIGLEQPWQAVSGVLGIVLVALVAAGWLTPSSKLNFVLYKGASIYMLGIMILLIVGGL